MPLPTDPKLLALSEDLVKAFDAVFGLHPGFRPTHAKGVMLAGTFQPSPAAASLTCAQHMTQQSTPVWVRYSNFTGLPLIPDNDPNANPRGVAIRFHLSDHVHTDIIAHSANGFPASNGEEFLGFLRAIGSSDPKNLAGSPLEAFLGSHPKALAFVQLPNLVPSSFARETYFSIGAARFTNQAGQSRHARYRIVPEAGVDHLSATDAAARGPNFLFDELAERIAKGPITLKVVAQLANDGDNPNDSSEQWPEDRTLLDLGAITLTAPVANDAHEQKWIIFDPIPRLDGISPSDDPLLEVRAAVYLMSGRRRRAAEEAGAAKSGG